MTALIALVLVALVASLLAMADGALLASGSAATARVPDPERAHRALVLTRILAHLAAGIAAGLVALDAVPGRRGATVAAIAIVLAVATVVEGIARHAGYTRGSRAAGALDPIVRAADVAFRPVSALGTALEGSLTRWIPPADDRAPRHEGDVERFREVVAAESGASPAEQELLRGVFSLRRTIVREIMVPRVDVVGIERDAPWSEVVDRVRSSEHARVPVFRETLDNAFGVLYAKDLLASVVSGEEPPDWTTFVRPAVFIPDTKSVNDQLRDFKAQRTHLALVVDEYGGMAGIITIEDVLEIIVGDIQDEYDVDDPDVQQEGEDRFWVAGELSLAALSELLDANFEREDVTTVGGLLYEQFGRVPRAGESADIEGFHVIVERVRRRRIERVYFERQRLEAAG